MYYGLFVRVGHKLVRVDTTSGYTLDTAKREFANLILALSSSGIVPLLRPLPLVKQIDVRGPDKKYAKTPW